MARKSGYVREARRFLEDYTAGFDAREMRRLFDRDAADVYRVLTRDQPDAADGGFWHRARILFLGLSAKLSPARRLLFAACLFFTLLGLLAGGRDSIAGLRGIDVDLRAPVYLLLAIAGLVYLLAMELVDRVRYRDELEVARQLQSDLLPRAAPDLPGYVFAHSYRTANTIGGDYYDFLPLADGRLAVAVGDASGHGIAAGLLMAIANAALRSAVDLDPDPRRVVEAVNRVLVRTGDRRAFMTLFFGVLDPLDHHLDFACAGHPFPLLAEAGGGVRELGASGSLPLGLRASLAVPTGGVTLAPGDALVLFTDGLPEALDAERRAFGFERLAALAGDGGEPQGIHDRILAAHRAHVGDEPLADDLTLVVIGRGWR